jgi:hypothetical protein
MHGMLGAGCSEVEECDVRDGERGNCDGALVEGGPMLCSSDGGRNKGFINGPLERRFFSFAARMS